MPFFRKETQSHSTSSTTETKQRSLRSLFNRTARTPVKQPTQTQTHTCQAPAIQQPNPSLSLSQSTSETQFQWEDIDPPAEYNYLVSSNRSQTTLSATATPHHHQQLSQVEIASTDPSMLNHSHSNSSLPGYNDVSGAVVVDVDGYPRFLTPQEEEDRKDTLQRAVRERMMGLPRRTDFNWEASDGPVLPRYECEPPTGAVGVPAGVAGGGK
ncbi:uncharacterized protein APUU_80509S [Aspergillus puulaauensis]|uniref:Uncharacterized protein n=1 Tax=Aspergillus puulaauensis TaxID=1220207 RepID=A0A7R8AT98_9EURO|nr:uncharacterized protein APUU_80509S [Aspergillus puulaauensis]BCS30206.1 hypothetical protein APUU_80509S [Aspergillus puulaauensis]